MYATCVVGSMILKLVILITVWHREQLSKICPRIGFAPSVA